MAPLSPKAVQSLYERESLCGHKMDLCCLNCGHMWKNKSTICGISMWNLYAEHKMDLCCQVHDQEHYLRKTLLQGIQG